MILRVRTNLSTVKIEVEPTITLAELLQIIIEKLTIIAVQHPLSLASDIHGNNVFSNEQGRTLAEIGLRHGDEVHLVDRFEYSVVEKDYIDENHNLVKAGKRVKVIEYFASHTILEPDKAAVAVVENPPPVPSTEAKSAQHVTPAEQQSVSKATPSATTSTSTTAQEEREETLNYQDYLEEDDVRVPDSIRRMQLIEDMALGGHANAALELTRDDYERLEILRAQLREAGLDAEEVEQHINEEVNNIFSSRAIEHLAAEDQMEQFNVMSTLEELETLLRSRRRELVQDAAPAARRSAARQVAPRSTPAPAAAAAPVISSIKSDAELQRHGPNNRRFQDLLLQNAGLSIISAASTPATNATAGASPDSAPSTETAHSKKDAEFPSVTATSPSSSASALASQSGPRLSLQGSGYAAPGAVARSTNAQVITSSAVASTAPLTSATKSSVSGAPLTAHQRLLLHQKKLREQKTASTATSSAVSTASPSVAVSSAPTTSAPVDSSKKEAATAVGAPSKPNAPAAAPSPFRVPLPTGGSTTVSTSSANPRRLSASDASNKVSPRAPPLSGSSSARSAKETTTTPSSSSSTSATEKGRPVGAASTSVAPSAASKAPAAKPLPSQQPVKSVASNKATTTTAPSQNIRAHHPSSSQATVPAQKQKAAEEETEEMLLRRLQEEQDAQAARDLMAQEEAAFGYGDEGMSRAPLREVARNDPRQRLQPSQQPPAQHNGQRDLMQAFLQGANPAARNDAGAAGAGGAQLPAWLQRDIDRQLEADLLEIAQRESRQQQQQPAVAARAAIAAPVIPEYDEEDELLAKALQASMMDF